MIHRTRSVPFSARPATQRSSWLVRVLFVLVAMGLLVEGVVVAALVGFTFLRLTDEHEGMENVRTAAIVRRVTPFGGQGEAANVAAWDRHGPLNILLLGLDVDDCLEPDGIYRRTDTIILVRVDPQTHRAAMMSIPRDLYVSYLVEAPGQAEPYLVGRKINTAHLFGERDADMPGGGPEMVKQVIEENLGIPIHRYARVDFKGFKRIIDALEGVDIDIPPSPEDPTVGLYDPNYPDGHCGTITVSFDPGPQHLEGDEALQYARSRSTTSDFDRSRRQMDVLLAMRERGMSLGAIRRLPELVPAALDTVDTDFSPAELFSLARVAREMGPGDIATFQIDESVVYDQWLVIDTVPQAVLMLQPDAFDMLLIDFLAFGVEEVTTSGESGSGVN